MVRSLTTPPTGALGKELTISDANAAQAIKEINALVDATKGKGKWTWSLDGESCFELVAKIVRVAKPDQVIPASLNGSSKQRDALLAALNAIMDGG